MTELIALLEGRQAGTVVRARSGRLTFSYSPAWRSRPGAYPLSLSMPLAASEHSHAAIDAFLWGLLPDNEIVLQRWAQRFHVSPRNAFSLISHVGEDCAGAVQFVTPARYEMPAQVKEGTEWLTDSEVATRLHAMKSDISAGRWLKDQGQFSLAGAQPKTALLYDGRRWGVPYGRTPTTHILKPAFHLDGHAYNEHLCVALARSIGLPTVKTEVRDFGGIAAIVVERYDRVDTAKLAALSAAMAAEKAAETAMHAASDAESAAMLSAESAAAAAKFAEDAELMANFSKTTPFYRVHQEDFCQSLAIHPERKYQNQGGPGPLEIIGLLRTYAAQPIGGKRIPGKNSVEEDIAVFISALLFNWIIAGTDAHAKNYSVLLGGNGVVRLAPLYDIASILPYDHIDLRKTKLAMKVGGKYEIDEIKLTQWKKFSADAKIDSAALIDEIRAICAVIPDALSSETRKLESNGIRDPLIEKLSRLISARALKLGKL